VHKSNAAAVTFRVSCKLLIGTSNAALRPDKIRNQLSDTVIGSETAWNCIDLTLMPGIAKPTIFDEWDIYLTQVDAGSPNM
jgi:hypothetical protein